VLPTSFLRIPKTHNRISLKVWHANVLYFCSFCNPTFSGATREWDALYIPPPPAGRCCCSQRQSVECRITISVLTRLISVEYFTEYCSRGSFKSWRLGIYELPIVTGQKNKQMFRKADRTSGNSSTYYHCTRNTSTTRILTDSVTLCNLITQISVSNDTKTNFQKLFCQTSIQMS
jgi:hypothetical protein